MIIIDPEMRREAICGTLAHRAGAAPDAGAVAQATVEIWQQMAQCLAPVIGARGVDALFGRSLLLAGKNYPWLAVAGIRGGSDTALVELRSCIESREPAVAVDAGCNLLSVFTVLLAGLIGDALTGRLLDAVLSPPVRARALA